MGSRTPPGIYAHHYGKMGDTTRIDANFVRFVAKDGRVYDIRFDGNSIRVQATTGSAALAVYPVSSNDVRVFQADPTSEPPAFCEDVGWVEGGRPAWATAKGEVSDG